jgi:hypothetical protein
MDPYLERHQCWNAVHTRLIVAIADALSPQVRPHYRVDIELRTYIALFSSDSPVGVPDVLIMAPPVERVPAGLAAASTRFTPQLVELPMPEQIRERYLTVRDAATEEVITVIELLSLANKLTSEGRTDYLGKRLQVVGSQTNLVEIDLLRAGDPLPPFQAGESDYRILVSPAVTRPQAQAHHFGVRDVIPDFSIPLRPGESQPMLELNRLLHEVYERGSYDLAIDYSQPPTPPLRPADAIWARALLEQR